MCIMVCLKLQIIQASFQDVPRKICSENVQQIYRRTPMLKRDFNKVDLQLY